MKKLLDDRVEESNNIFRKLEQQYLFYLRDN